MWSPNGKVWSPEMKNVESKILQSRSVMMMIDATLTFRSKGDVYTNAPPHFWSIYLHCVHWRSQRGGLRGLGPTE